MLRLLLGSDEYLKEVWTSPRSRGQVIETDYRYLSYKSPRSGGEVLEPNIVLAVALFLGGFAAALAWLSGREKT